MNKEELETKNKAIVHKDNSLNRLDLSFIKHIELSEYKKSELLAYWIHDYAVYHDEERTFDISKSGVFQRGEVIKVIGHINDPGVDILSIAAKHDINDEFTPEVMEEVDSHTTNFKERK